MIFLIDVDGVVADLIPYVLELLKEESKKNELFDIEDLPTLKDIQWDVFSKKESRLPPPALEWILNEIKKPGFNTNLPIVPGALEGIEEIRQNGQDIYWLTAPWWGSPTWEHDRRKWIAKHFGDNHEKVIFAHAKYICKGDVLIDDRVKNIKHWSKFHPDSKAFLFRQPWNSDEKYDVYQRFDWSDTDKLLDSLK